MRLIDADALLKTLKNEKIPYNSDINYFILNARTVDGVKHGRWVEVPDEVFASTYYCSECKGEAIPDIYGKYLLSNWCYYCGAKMDEVTE